MVKLRSVLGLISGVILVLSSGAHTFLGWQALEAELARTNAPAELVTGLEIGWRWGGAAMLVFGAWALVHSNYDPFFFIFIVPGVLLALASTGR